MVRVLVVEDEANIREMIALNLRLTRDGSRGGRERRGRPAAAGQEARLRCGHSGCDAAGHERFSLCETIRRTDQKIGIIILSAKGQEQDKIRGLSIGADDT